MELLLQDLVYGFRGILSRKGLSLAVILTLGLAIGVNTTLFSLARTILFAILPFENPESIVMLWSHNPEMNRMREPSSLPDFLDLRRELQSFRGLSAWSQDRRALTGAEEPVFVQGLQSSPDFFDVTGLSVISGRAFLEGEDRAGANPVALLSHGAWERRFGGDPGILGSTLELDSIPHTVVGIVAPSTEAGVFSKIEVWTPLPVDAASARDNRHLYIIGRLDEGVSFEQASLEVESVSKRLAQANTHAGTGWSHFAQPLVHAIVGPNVETITLLLAMTVSFVLLIACANVAHMLLARSESRRRELQIRVALGATRLRLLRQLLTEALVLSTVGALVGLLFTQWTLRALAAATRDQVGLFAQPGVNFGVLGFALAMGFLTPLLFALLPGIRVSTVALRERGATPRSHRGRQVLIAGEVALALVLLVIAALAVSSYRALRHIDLGFRPENVLTMQLEVPEWSQPEMEGVSRFFDEVLKVALRTPGLRSASLTSQRPIEDSGPNQTFEIAGGALADPQADPSAATVVVSPGFFLTLEIALLEGRDFESADTATSTPVAIVSRAARVRYWSESSPLGARLRLGRGRWLEVVGVVSDVRNSDADQPPEPQIYLPYSQNPQRSMALLLRAEGDPLALVPPATAAIREIDRALPIDDVRTMSQVVVDDLAGDFALIGLMAYFTFVALGLASAGIGAVASHSVSERSKEIGIRMAIGAKAGQVLAMVLRQGMLPVAVGLIIGSAASLALSRTMASMVYGISPTDPGTYLAMAGILAAVAFAASFVPALRAARTDPVSVLRGE